MSKISLLLSSPAMWSLVGVFVIGGLTSILPQLHGNTSVLVQFILGGLALYFHPQEIKTAGSTGKTMMGSVI